MTIFKYENKSALKGNDVPKLQASHGINETGKNQIYEKQWIKAYITTYRVEAWNWLA